MQVTYQGNAGNVVALITKVPIALAGGNDPYQLVNPVLTAAGVALLGCVREDFITKSRGGTGRDGIKWQQLSPVTIAQRRLGPADRKALKQREAKLSAADKKQLDVDYKRRLANLRLRGMQGSQATALARAQAY